MAERAIEMIVQVAGEDVPAGQLWAHRRRNTESATFAYDEASGHLTRTDAYELDPALPLAAGQQQTPVERVMFGAFSDCAPDRWGRRLIDRAERLRAKREAGAPRSFGEVDYLLGVRDDLRQGALRFREVIVASDRAGLSLFVILAIAIQNIPEGTSVAIPMEEAGFGRRRQSPRCCRRPSRAPSAPPRAPGSPPAPP